MSAMPVREAVWMKWAPANAAREVLKSEKAGVEVARPRHTLEPEERLLDMLEGREQTGHCGE